MGFTNLFILFPVHLFSDINNLKNKDVYLIEDPRYFTDFKYHRLKLAYHRATMKSYFDYLKSKKINVKYIDFNYNIKKLYKSFNKKYKNIETYDLGDNVLKNRLLKIIPSIQFTQTHNFLVNQKLLEDNIDKFYNGKRFNFMNFYKWQRIRLNILIDKNNKPIGNHWTFDKDNRKKLPDDVIIPKTNILINQDSNKYIEEAREYVMKNFKDNYGSLDNFIYPINFEQSKKWLDYFLKKKFITFGIYEDAVDKDNNFLFHSVLSPMMNIGLLTDNEVINETLKYQGKVPINSFEGFIRQIIGWRNYVYSVYLLKGDTIKKSNFLKHKNKLNFKVMWEGKTGILPIDNVIKNIVEYGYCHHIERLMYIGNFLLLCTINPNNIYKWFMEWSIDGYDWVMILNVYCMSQYSSTILTTRPYISSSNYILKMSNYKKADWCNIFDNLFYNFVNKHKKYLSTNYSTAIFVKFWNKKSKKEQNNIIKNAKTYLRKMNFK